MSPVVASHYLVVQLGEGDTVVAKRHSKSVISAVAALLALGSLVGCAGAAAPSDLPAGDYPDLTLAESKSPAQLLRNTAVTRIPAATVLNVGTEIDGSIACLSEEQDPKGYIRQWVSSVDVNLRLPEAPNTDAIVDSVLATFIDEGWMSQQIAGSSEDSHADLLTNGTSAAAGVSAARVRIEAVVANDGASSFIHIEALGPCVVTDGTDSSEVTTLGTL